MFTMRRVAWAAKQAAAAPAGQVVLLTGTTSWTVPAGVTSICVVAVQGGSTPVNGASPVTVTVSGTVVCRAQNENRLGDGGGDGGVGGAGSTDSETYQSNAGGGGAGGYSGNGGKGGDGTPSSTPPLSGAGNGGGGSGGACTYWTTGGTAGYGGGVGLLGQGSNGAAVGSGSNWSQNGNPGSNGSAQTYGGGAPGANSYYPNVNGGRGGALAYKNNIVVTPGQVVTVSIPATLSAAGPAAIRIIWGAGRSFPSTNTGDM